MGERTPYPRLSACAVARAVDRGPVGPSPYMPGRVWPPADVRQPQPTAQVAGNTRNSEVVEHPVPSRTEEMDSNRVSA
jgi:hypothetical protein